MQFGMRNHSCGWGRRPGLHVTSPMFFSRFAIACSRTTFRSSVAPKEQATPDPGTGSCIISIRSRDSLVLSALLMLCEAGSTSSSLRKTTTEGQQKDPKQQTRQTDLLGNVDQRSCRTEFVVYKLTIPLTGTYGSDFGKHKG
jgi:hypothetical protein